MHGDIIVTVHQAQGLPKTDFTGSTDPYVRVWINGKKSIKTTTVQKNQNPVWEQKFDIPVAGDIHTISFDVKDEDNFSPVCVREGEGERRMHSQCPSTAKAHNARMCTCMHTDCAACMIGWHVISFLFQDRVGTVHVAAAEFVLGFTRKPFPLAGGGVLVLSGVYSDVHSNVSTVQVVKSPFPARAVCGTLSYAYLHTHSNSHVHACTRTHKCRGTDCWTAALLPVLHSLRILLLPV